MCKTHLIYCFNTFNTQMLEKEKNIERTGDGQHIFQTSNLQEGKPTLLYVTIHFYVSKFLLRESNCSPTPYFRCIFS